jgi:hypothetical protein
LLEIILSIVHIMNSFHKLIWNIDLIFGKVKIIFS